MSRLKPNNLSSDERVPSVLICGEELLADEFREQCSRYGIKSIQRFQKGRQILAGLELTNSDILAKKKNLVLLDKRLPKNRLIFSSSVTVTISEQARWLEHPGRLLGISAFPTLLSGSLIEISPAPETTTETVLKAKQFFFRFNKEIAVVQDRVGMVLPRILCMLINEAYFACMEEIAHPSDIDLAMKLGTNYPNGPLEWSQKITPKQVVGLLDALWKDLGEERYRVAPLLRMMATNQR